MKRMSSRLWMVLLVVIVVGLVGNPIGPKLAHAVSMDTHLKEWREWGEASKAYPRNFNPPQGAREADRLHMKEWAYWQLAWRKNSYLNLSPPPFAWFSDELHKEVFNSNALSKQRFLLAFAQWGNLNQLTVDGLERDFHFFATSQAIGLSATELKRHLENSFENVNKHQGQKAKFQCIMAYAHFRYNNPIPVPDTQDRQAAIEEPFIEWMERFAIDGPEEKKTAEFAYELVRSWGYDALVHPSWEPSHSH